jgi:hypothetical protein
VVLQHENSDWEVLPFRDFRKLRKRSWSQQSYFLPKGIGRIRCVKLVLNSENEMRGRIVVSHPIFRESAAMQWEAMEGKITNEITGVMLRNQLEIPPTRRLKELAYFISATEKLPEIKALRVGSVLPEEEAILRELPNFKSMLCLERGGDPKNEACLVLPRLHQENRIFDLILLSPTERFELLLTESYHGFNLLEIGGLLSIHDVRVPPVNRVVRFLLKNRNIELPCLTPTDSSTAIFSRKLFESPRPWDHFESF